MSGQLLKITTVAESLGLSRQQVYRLMKEKELHYIKVGGVYRILRSDFQAFLERGYSGGKLSATIIEPAKVAA